MQFEETAATQEALDFSDPSENTGTEALGTGGLFPETAAPDRPLPPPQAHRVRVTAVTEGAWPSGDAYIKISLTSLENAADQDFIVSPPKSFTENVLIDPNTLSNEETINQNGNTVPSERAQFARSVRNSGKTAKKGGYYPNTTQYVDAGGQVPGDGTLETIMRLSLEQGHRVNLQTPRTFAQIAEYLNALCTGTECVALLKAQGGDSEFADRLKVQRLVSQEYADQETSFKNYRKLWQT